MRYIIFLQFLTTIFAKHWAIDLVHNHVVITEDFDENAVENTCLVTTNQTSDLVFHDLKLEPCTMLNQEVALAEFNNFNVYRQDEIYFKIGTKSLECWHKEEIDEYKRGQLVLTHCDNASQFYYGSDGHLHPKYYPRQCIMRSKDGDVYATRCHEIVKYDTVTGHITYDHFNETKCGIIGNKGDNIHLGNCTTDPRAIWTKTSGQNIEITKDGVKSCMTFDLKDIAFKTSTNNIYYKPCTNELEQTFSIDSEGRIHPFGQNRFCVSMYKTMEINENNYKFRVSNCDKHFLIAPKIEDECICPHGTKVGGQFCANDATPLSRPQVQCNACDNGLELSVGNSCVNRTMFIWKTDGDVDVDMNIASKKINKLESLDYRGSKLKTIPEGFRFRDLIDDHVDGDKIRSIRLENNKLESFPQNAFDGLDNIEYMAAGSNNFETLNEHVFNGLTNLKTIGMSDNKFSQMLPKDLLLNLQNLEKITLINNNQELFIHKNFLKFNKKLVEIRLSDNRMKQIPAGLFNRLNHLEYLDISNNAMVDLPPRLIRGLSSLKNIQMSGVLANAEIEHYVLPKKFFHELPELKHIEMRNNEISEVPDLSQAPKLETLDIENNEVKHLKNGMFSQNSALTIAIFRGNLIETIEDDSFTGAINLEKLNLANNALKSVSNNVVKDLKKLKLLYFDKNCDTVCVLNSNEVNVNTGAQNNGWQCKGVPTCGLDQCSCAAKPEGGK